jgi:large subunit ribosomal protein L6
MSRVGKKPVTIPEGVTITLDKRSIVVAGPKGSLSMKLHRKITAEIIDNEVNLSTKSHEKAVTAMYGTTRNLIQNMIIGVTKGFEKRLKLVGTGYRVKQSGSNLELSLGLSHPVVVKPEEDVQLAIEGQDEIIVTGIDKQRVGQLAANIRGLRPPEPYKGKGIRYKDEHIMKKAGKAGKSE